MPGLASKRKRGAAPLPTQTAAFEEQHDGKGVSFEEVDASDSGEEANFAPFEGNYQEGSSEEEDEGPLIKPRLLAATQSQQPASTTKKGDKAAGAFHSMGASFLLLQKDAAGLADIRAKVWTHRSLKRC